MAIKRRIDISPEELISRMEDVATAVAMGYAVDVRRNGKTLFVLVSSTDLADLLQIEMFFVESADQQETSAGLSASGGVEQAPVGKTSESSLIQVNEDTTVGPPRDFEQRSPTLLEVQ